MLQKLVNSTPHVVRSRNHIFPSYSHILSGTRSFSSITSNSLHPLKLHSVTRTLIIRNSTNFDKGDVSQDQDRGIQELALPNVSLSVESVLKFISTNLLALALFGASVFALINPGPGCFAHRYKISTFSTIGIFLITGLTLRNEEIGEAAEAWPVGLFGLVSILLLTPFFSRIMLNIRLQPQEFVTGLALYNCMPTSISSGVSLAKLAGGNSALALAMTVLSNLLGILIVPFSVSKLIRGGVGASVPADKLFKSLIVTVLIPLIMGKVFRDYIKGAADIVDSNRKLFAALGSILLSLNTVVAVIMGAVLHIVLLCLNFIWIRILCGVSGGNESIFANRENYRSLLIVASQKTISMLVAVVEQLGGTFGEAGLLVLPCITAHISQIMIDSLIVGYWNKEKQSLEKAN
uniref:Probable sodium/metabolite cotransporter BASS4, chloroplastic n=1 Tax=Tanacetum cinerariifolium TaxID=118510 RepID=A0A699HGA2_TANCI|nr:probable sodium/metabolite cotransporter BASS4, chloroplastic [Tanacetum cinerariifolium]